jgi:hypothetical protein
MADRFGINAEQYKKVQYFAQGRSIQLVLLELDGTISVKIDNVWYDIGTPKFTQKKKKIKYTNKFQRNSL